MRLAVAAVALVVAVGPGAAENGSSQGYKALIGRLVRSRCHMNSCGWFAIETADLVAESATRSLFKIQEKDWASDYPDGNYKRNRPRYPTGESTRYVVCSRVDPALIDDDGETWTQEHLFPGAKDGIFGANESALAIYWATCHGLNVQDVYAATRIARNLGYTATAPDNPLEDTKLKAPTDVMLAP